MKKRDRRKNIASSVTEGVVRGICVSCLIIFAGSFGLAKMLDNQIVRWENVGYWIMVQLLLASFAGSVTTCRSVKRKWLQMSMLTAVLFWVILMGITALFFGGQYEGVIVTAGLIFAGSLSAGLLGVKPQGKRGYKIPNRRG